MNIYVGNIPRESTESEIKNLFEEFGTVASVNLIRDNYTKMPKGFGFVEMPDKEQAEKAINELNGGIFNGRPLTINPARPRNENQNNRERKYRSSY